MTTGVELPETLPAELNPLNPSEVLVPAAQAEIEFTVGSLMQVGTTLPATLEAPSRAPACTAAHRSERPYLAGGHPPAASDARGLPSVDRARGRPSTQD